MVCLCCYYFENIIKKVIVKEIWNKAAATPLALERAVYFLYKKDWTINMKIKFLIDKSYKEPEIHICSAEDTPEIRGVIKAIKKTIDISFNALDNDNTVVVNASDIIRFYSANKMVYVTTAEGDYRIK